MQIPKEQSEKLKRYFINADPFLWGVLEAKNKKGRLKELKKMGFLQSYSEGSNATYSKINQDLLVDHGIDNILEHIVIPRVTKAFATDVLQYFQRGWDFGQNPDIKYLTGHNLYQRVGRVFRVVGHRDPAQLFLQIDTQHKFVERWTVFAGLWFEEIEPLLGSTREGVSERSNIESGLKPSTAG